MGRVWKICILGFMSQGKANPRLSDLLQCFITSPVLVAIKSVCVSKRKENINILKGKENISAIQICFDVYLGLSLLTLFDRQASEYFRLPIHYFCNFTMCIQPLPFTCKRLPNKPYYVNGITLREQNSSSEWWQSLKQKLF